ncbi:MAG: hypothetical protein HZB38_10765 [Planctomycetes bacterium]|nr:hypothetical protein [Planctomycetota bacterium]
MSVRHTRRLSAACLIAMPAVLAIVSVSVFGTVPTTLNDFHMPGTQPGGLQSFMIEVQNCEFCHGGYDEAQEPYTRWAASLMGQAARDPVFFACLSIANQDAAFVGDLCLRCHTPVGFLEGRTVPTDGSALFDKDLEGVTCSTCHRMLDPVYDPGVSPAVDQSILAGLAEVNPNPHSGQYVIDPLDRRRGPFELDPNFYFHAYEQSPFHRESLLCGTCHDVSNPAFSKQPDGTYALNALDEPHPTHNKYDEFPVERTFSEWLMSAFAQGPIEMGGRFGGNITAVGTCQDCHMPKTSGVACLPDLGVGIYRTNLPQHNFNGANTWVIPAIRSIYPDYKTGLNQDSVAAAGARTVQMLQAASDMELTQHGHEVNLRIINQSGHKLPTGYPEGRRMWLNVKFFDSQNQLVSERGAYDFNTAVLTGGDTKVYETRLGLDAAVAAATGLPEGESFHFVLNNLRLFDNRIPPRGFANAAFAAVQADPVGYSYADGQFWDDTRYPIPFGACRAEARLYYQTTSKEYIEFLRDANTTDGNGQLAYDKWVEFGKSAPVELDLGTIQLAIPGDLDGDSDVDLGDLTLLLSAFGISTGGDINGDGVTDVADLALLLAYFGSVCQ